VALDPQLRAPELAVGTLGAALAVGTATGFWTAEDSASGWPSDAGQVLVTLLVAAVLEQYTLPRETIGWYGVFLAVLLAVGVLAALALSIRSGSAGGGFTAVESGLVNGAIGALGLIVVIGLLWRIWPNPEANGH